MAKDAVALIKADHRKVEKLFKEFEQTGGEKRKQDLVEEICTELEAHAKIEEEIFGAPEVNVGALQVLGA